MNKIMIATVASLMLGTSAYAQETTGGPVATPTTPAVEAQMESGTDNAMNNEAVLIIRNNTGEECVVNTVQQSEEEDGFLSGLFGGNDEEENADGVVVQNDANPVDDSTTIVGDNVEVEEVGENQSVDEMHTYNIGAGQDYILEENTNDIFYVDLNGEVEDGSIVTVTADLGECGMVELDATARNNQTKRE